MMAKYRTRSLAVDATQSITGDWRVVASDGRVFDCPPDVFAATYEPIPEPRPMALRFGPRIDHTIPTEPAPTPDTPPDAPPAKLPVEIDAFIGDAVPLDDGTFRLECGANVPAYSAESSKVLKTILAVAVPDGQPLPETEQGFIDSPYSRGGLDLAPPDGNPVTVAIPISGVPAGKLIIQFILVDED